MSVFTMKGEDVYNIFSNEPLHSVAILYDIETLVMLRVGTKETIMSTMHAVYNEDPQYARTLGTMEFDLNDLESKINAVNLLNTFWGCTGSFKNYMENLSLT